MVFSLVCSFPLSVMYLKMTIKTKALKIFDFITTSLTSIYFVMDLKVSNIVLFTTYLTMPNIFNAYVVVAQVIFYVSSHLINLIIRSTSLTDSDSFDSSSDIICSSRSTRIITGDSFG